MLDFIKKHWLGYALEILGAIVVYNFLGLVAFLIYVYIVLVIKIDVSTDYLRKLIRISWVENEIKIYGIMKKLKMTDQEIVKVEDDQKNMFSKDQRERYERDVKDISI